MWSLLTKIRLYYYDVMKLRHNLLTDDIDEFASVFNIRV